jgi:hypothetical protein
MEVIEVISVCKLEAKTIEELENENENKNMTRE